MDEKEINKAFERSVEKYLEKKYAQFGRWTLGLIGMALFTAFLHFLFWMESNDKKGLEKIIELPLK